MDPATEGIDRPDAAEAAKAPTTKPRKRFVGTSARATGSRAAPRKVANQIPDEILNDPALKEAMRGGFPGLLDDGRGLKLT